jgi:hypothetical protein
MIDLELAARIIRATPSDDDIAKLAQQLVGETENTLIDLHVQMIDENTAENWVAFRNLVLAAVARRAHDIATQSTMSRAPVLPDIPLGFGQSSAPVERCRIGVGCRKLPGHGGLCKLRDGSVCQVMQSDLAVRLIDAVHDHQDDSDDGEQAVLAVQQVLFGAGATQQNLLVKQVLNPANFPPASE